MSYYLHDKNGYLADGPSVQGLEDFALSAQSYRAISLFLKNGKTTDLSALVDELEKLDGDRVGSAILGAAKRAKEELVLTDGVEEDETRALSAQTYPAVVLAESHVESLKTSLNYAFAKGRAALRQGKDAKHASREVHDALLRVLPRHLREIAVSGGQMALDALVKMRHAEESRGLSGPLKITFSPKNQNASDWADKHAGELAKNLSDESLAQISDALAQMLEEGSSFEEMRGEILDAVGDDARADLIARTETMRAVNFGQREGWNQAVEDGLLTGNEQRVWIATEGFSCDLCSALDGEKADLDGQYPLDGGDGPPLHPRCACTEGITS